jgi:hypothetical protein
MQSPTGGAILLRGCEPGVVASIMRNVRATPASGSD